MNPTGDFTVNVWVKAGASSNWQSAVTSRSASTTCGEDTNQTSGYMFTSSLMKNGLFGMVDVLVIHGLKLILM